MEDNSFDLSEYYRLLGAVSVNCAKIELGLFDCISQISSPNQRMIDPEVTACLIGGDNMAVLLAKLDKVFRTKVRDKKLLAGFAEIRKLINSVNLRRGVHIHSVPVSLDAEMTLAKWKRDLSKNGESLFQIEKLSLRRLKALAVLSELVDAHLMDFFEKNIEKIHSDYQREREAIK
jgi:hypothetical protein